MKLTAITAAAAILAAAILADPAQATGNHTPKEPPSTPKPTPAPPAPTPVYVGGSPSASSATTLNANPAASSMSTSGATAGATSSATGGNGGSGGQASATSGDSKAIAGDSTSGATLQDSSSFWSQSRALGLTFAPGAFTPPMAPVQCASATITQSARGLGMGILSKADSKTDSSDCTLIQMRNAAVAACKFETAKKIEDGIVLKHLPNFKPSETTYLKDNNDPGYVDYSPTQCALLTSPPPKPEAPVQLNWIYVPPPVARTEEKPAEPIVPKPRTKVVKRKPAPPTQACGEGGVPMCVPSKQQAGTPKTS